MQAARPSRLQLTGAIHHVALLRESRAWVHAYCWMSNDLHLVVEIPPGLMAGWQDELIRRSGCSWRR